MCRCPDCDVSPGGGTLLYDDIRVTMTSKQLNGSQRVLLDGVITEDECRELHHLSNVSYQESRTLYNTLVIATGSTGRLIQPLDIIYHHVQTRLMYGLSQHMRTLG